MTAALATRNVVITGAGGKTGRLVLKKLLERPAFVPKGVVRTEESKQKLMKEMDIPEDVLVVANVCIDDLSEICGDADALIVCTSATPDMTGEMKDGKPVFGFPNGHPYEVDWLGQRNQIDAVSPGAHVVICSSMGGTAPENPLNKLGRNEDIPETGNILWWKRKAEKYLIDSGRTYTIIHPGGLLDEEGGKRELVLGVDDKETGGTENRSIPRADVAELLIASLECEAYKNRSFDARSKPEGEGTITTDMNALIEMLNGENCDYSLGIIPEDDF